VAGLLSACVSGPPDRASPARPSATAPTTFGGGYYKVGNPYQIEGQWYYPREQPDYEETGVASWYGEAFHGKATANGEVFDKRLVTAAHPTLPMPVNVRVTNLENGRSLVVRVNDRGPFRRGRVIDLSEHAAELLGYKQQGTARVKVSFLERAPLNMRVPEPLVLASAPAQPAANLRPAGFIQVSAASDDDAGPPNAIYVSAGAYGSLQNANSVIAKLRGLGAHLLPITRDGRPLYRVRIGPFQSEAQAARVLDEVIGLGHNGASIVVE
jgi:rare lipoprotein A